MPSKPPWITLAEGELGVHEMRGGENPRILEYFTATTLKATEDEVPWCSAFVNWVMRECGMERSRSAAARSWLKYGKRLAGYEQYSIVVLRRGSSLWQGHVGFAVDDLGSHIGVLGGNQGDEVSFQIFPKSHVIGYARPAPLTTSPIL